MCNADHDREVELESAEQRLRDLADRPLPPILEGAKLAGDRSDEYAVSKISKRLDGAISYVLPMDFRSDRVVVEDLDAIASRAAGDGYQRGREDAGEEILALERRHREELQGLRRELGERHDQDRTRILELEAEVEERSIEEARLRALLEDVTDGQIPADAEPEKREDAEAEALLERQDDNARGELYLDDRPEPSDVRDARIGVGTTVSVNGVPVTTPSDVRAIVEDAAVEGFGIRQKIREAVDQATEAAAAELMTRARGIAFAHDADPPADPDNDSGAAG